MLFTCLVECVTLVGERNSFVLYESSFVYIDLFNGRKLEKEAIMLFAFTIQNYVLGGAEINFMMGY